MIKSILVWPKEIELGWSDECENISDDNHSDEYSAKCVCQTLIRKGFGCGGRVFPLAARVEVDGVKTFEWIADQGYVIDTIEEKSLMKRYSGIRF